MTYLEFYKLREDPFATVYDRSKYFATAACESVLRSLGEGIAQRRGVMLLTGRIGIGKTFSLNQLCGKLPPDWLAVHILNSPQSGTQLLQQLASYAGLPHRKTELADLSGRLQKRFSWINEHGRRVVVIFDESESLSPEVVERVTWLAGLEAMERKLVQIILVTRPGFRNQFTQAMWAPIRQRVALSCELNPMSEPEVAGYIDQRIRCAADLGCVVEFAAEAKSAIARASGGLPRMVNAISRGCLMHGLEVQVQYIEGEVVAAVLDEIGADENECDVAPPAPVATPIAIEGEGAAAAATPGELSAGRTGCSRDESGGGGR